MCQRRRWWCRAHTALATLALGGGLLVSVLRKAWLRASAIAARSANTAQLEEFDGQKKKSTIFGLSKTGEVFFLTRAKTVSDSGWVQLTGPPCGLVWGVPVDVAASSQAIWVVCKREFRSTGGLSTEHFLFAKWGWSPQNNHAWWHLVHGPNVVQIDTEGNAIWGVDATGSILWRPAASEGHQTGWQTVGGPPSDGVLKMIAADRDNLGVWLWCVDSHLQVWRRTRLGSWSHADEQDRPFWPEPMGRPAVLRAEQGNVWALNSEGLLFWRALDGTCCQEFVTASICWCREEAAPYLADIADGGSHGIGFHIGRVFHRDAEGGWGARPNRQVLHLASRDEGISEPASSQVAPYFAETCAEESMLDDVCNLLNATVKALQRGWIRERGRVWNIWEWGELKNQYWKCQGSARWCQAPLKHFGAFRDKYMKRAFCCARQQLTPEDPTCRSSSCKAYDMNCPGSQLLTSDRDCTVYHSSDPGALISQMSRLVTSSIAPLVKDPRRATAATVFDVSLFGTWTWIPDKVFRRFDWPESSKALFQQVPGFSSIEPVWVFRRKCMDVDRAAILERLEQVLSGEKFDSAGTDVRLDLKLKEFVGNFAKGAYGDGKKLRDWHNLHRDFHDVARLQQNGYLTYPTVLEIVGRQQGAVAAIFEDERKCVRQVSFLEQLTFIAQKCQGVLSEGLNLSNFNERVASLFLVTGKYFDRLLDFEVQHTDQSVSPLGLPMDDSVLFHVLESIHGVGPIPDDPLSQAIDLWSSRWTAAAGQTVLTGAEVRRRACMDIAMWGNAARHTEALRADAGDLVRPLVQTFFTCFVPADTPIDSQNLTQVILASLRAWAEAVPRSQTGVVSLWMTLAFTGPALFAVTCCVWACLRRNPAAPPPEFDVPRVSRVLTDPTPRGARLHMRRPSAPTLVSLNMDHVATMPGGPKWASEMPSIGD